MISAKQRIAILKKQLGNMDCDLAELRKANAELLEKNALLEKTRVAPALESKVAEVAAANKTLADRNQDLEKHAAKNFAINHALVNVLMVMYERDLPAIAAFLHTDPETMRISASAKKVTVQGLAKVALKKEKPHGKD